MYTTLGYKMKIIDETRNIYILEYNVYNHESFFSILLTKIIIHTI